MLDIVKGLLAVRCSLIIGSMHIMLSKYLVYAICHEVGKNALGAGKTKKEQDIFCLESTHKGGS